jgi:hypothetical protein
LRQELKAVIVDEEEEEFGDFVSSGKVAFEKEDGQGVEQEITELIDKRSKMSFLVLKTLGCKEL